jgi:2-C-methyl-D-erythritol 4-phosphate cytidylyltransferase
MRRKDIFIREESEPLNYAVILAGGRGIRFGNSGIPKQFIEMTGLPMIAYSMRTAQMNDNIHRVCVVAPPSSHEQVKRWAREYGADKCVFFAESGKERHESVYSGICAVPAKNDDTVMIMTSVCPFVSQRTIDNHYNTIKMYGGAITVVKATDAITFSNDGKRANRTLQKKRLFIQQGPQTYRYGLLTEAHSAYLSDAGRSEVYEDSELVLNLGIDVGMVMGDRFCLKVTYPEDLAIVEALYPLFMKQENEYIGEKLDSFGQQSPPRALLG